MKPSSTALAFFLLLLASQHLVAANYQLVNIVHLKTEDFKGNYENSKGYADIAYPDCPKNAEVEIDFGNYLLGAECFYGGAEVIEVVKKDTHWRVYLPLCSSNQLLIFSRKVHVYCVET